MSLRPAPYLLCLSLLVALAGCAPRQHYAGSHVAYQRFELAPAADPQAVSRWYQCFASEDPLYRQWCLARIAHVRVEQGPNLWCEPVSATLCRTFPVYAPRHYTPSTVDDDDAGGDIADAFGRLLLGIIEAAVDSGDDSDFDDHDKAKRDDDDERDSARSEQRRHDDPARLRRPETSKRPARRR